ncbi:MAG: Smr/MutS family protein, partial [Clostridiales Family XIII bacterium]|nr:Smr/MutS family protein [Clostridiales Family XIII bacterium]
RSKGGSTVFIEPQAVVDANNALRALEADEQAEIDRILAEISAEVGACAHALLLNQELLVALDLIFAKGKLAEDMKAVRPEIQEGGAGVALTLSMARHPLIDSARVVPISLALGGAYNALIITGPNTGGKTVTLKTVGLFLLMAEAGLFLPAEQASIPLVRQVFADIGDEQSIEQSLSTFSAHMRNIVEIVRDAGSQTVVLLDELGAGTDPTEGAALAIALLEELRGRGALVLATTHYTELKKYAIAEEGVENASMEFDVETLSPTYRLRLGIPGSSNAFEIAGRLGLPARVVQDAAARLDSGSIAFAAVIEQAEQDRVAAEADRAAAVSLREEAERERAALRNQRSRFEEKQEALLEKGRAGATAKIEEAEEYADIVKSELKELLDEAETLLARARNGSDSWAMDGDGGGRSRGDFYRGLDEGRKALRKLKAEYAADGGGDARGAGSGTSAGASGGGKGRNKRAKRARDRAGSGAASAAHGGQDAVAGALQKEEIRPGLTVLLTSINQQAEVLSPPDERGEVSVQAGRIRMTVPVDSLRRVEGKGKARVDRESSGRISIVRTKVSSIATSVDVHGMNLDDALMQSDKYLDDAFLAGLHEVSIIHGRGEGILKNGIRAMLKKHRHVKTSRPGDAFEGGDGVTIVTLK